MRLIFELQASPLDNRAASCTCSAWRRAANATHIPFLHLHATANTPEHKWAGYLKSRLSIGHLKLTRPATWVDRGHYHVFTQTGQSTMFHPDIRCKSLFLGEHLARHIGNIFQAHLTLQHLTLEWNTMPSNYKGARFSGIPPSLTHLTQLTELTINMRNDLYAKMYLYLLKCYPTSLQSLNLHEFASQLKVESPNQSSVELSASPVPQKSEFEQELCPC